MDNNTFWLRIWSVVAATICVLIVSIAGGCANDSRIMAQMVKNGADPIAARCAVMASNTDKSICAIQAAKGAK